MVKLPTPSINPLKAQLTLDVTINSGQVTTTCTDNFGDPDPRFRVSIAGNALVTYPATDFCFTDLPNTQYSNTQACGNAIPTVVEICLRAFEDDGSFCNISPDCQEEICQDFLVPAPNTSVDYTLTIPTDVYYTVGFRYSSKHNNIKVEIQLYY